MTKFKIGDVVRLKQDADNWSNVLYGKDIIVSNDGKICEGSPLSSAECVAEYPEDFVLVKAAQEEDTSKRHVHHDMIVEWAKDPSRVVECYNKDLLKWMDCAESWQKCPIWNKDIEYRFKPVEPERVSLSGVFPETSLTVDELLETYDNTYTHREGLVAVANAAIKQYILDKETNEQA